MYTYRHGGVLKLSNDAKSSAKSRQNDKSHGARKMTNLPNGQLKHIEIDYFTILNYLYIYRHNYPRVWVCPERCLHMSKAISPLCNTIHECALRTPKMRCCPALVSLNRTHSGTFTRPMARKCVRISSYTIIK